MVPGLFGFQSQALPYLIHSLIPEGSRLSAGLSPFLPLVCLLLRFVVLLLAMPSTTLPYIQPFAEFYFVLSDRLLGAAHPKCRGEACPRPGVVGGACLGRPGELAFALPASHFLIDGF